MTERRIPEYLTKSLRIAADRIEGGDFAGGGIDYMLLQRKTAIRELT